MTILLTGATGFIGRHMLRLLLEEGHAVRAIIRDTSRARLPEHPSLKLIGGGLTGLSIVDIKGCDALIHLAAHGVVNGMNDWEACFRVNVTESMALLLKTANADVRQFVLCGSCFEYGRTGEAMDAIPASAPLNPIGAYAASKAAASIAAVGWALEREVAMAIVRPFHVYGDGEAPQRFWPSLKAAAESGSDFPMTLGQQVRDFVPAERAARLILSAGVNSWDRADAINIINIGSGHPCTLLAFAEKWWLTWQAPGRIMPGMIPYRPNEVMRYVPDLMPHVLR